MVSRVTLYGRLQVLWFALVLVGTVVVYSGNARPYVAPTVLPEGPATVGVVVGAALGGILVLGMLRRRAWVEMGRRMGFSTGSAPILSRETASALPVSVLPLPALSGTVDGRDVRVSTYARNEDGGDEGSTQTYTLVEASLDNPVEEGFLLGHAGGSSDPVSDVVSGPVELDTVDDEFVVLGPLSKTDARDVLSGRARSGLLDLEGADVVSVGDPTDAFLSALPSDGGGLLGSVGGILEAKLREHPANDASTVSIKTEGVVSDPTRLRQWAEAAVAVAERVDGIEVSPAPT